MGQEHECKDLLQEVFLKIYININKIKAADNIRAYLYRMTTNVIADHHRLKQKTREVSAAQSMEPAEEAVKPQDEYKLADCLRPMIDTLPEISKKCSKVVSFSLMIPFESGLINISVFGEISSVLAWLNFTEEIPIDRTRFEHWVEQQAKWLYSNYAPSDNPHLINLLKPDGYQFIKRIQIDPEIITTKIDDNGLYCETDIPEGHSCYHDFQNGLIHPATVMILDKIICSETGDDYRKSSTSKYLHENVKMEIHKCELITMIWTDRPLV